MWPRSSWAAALAMLTALRALVAAWTPLSPDEAYYWVWSRALAPGFLDHPPLVALWIRAGTVLCGNTAIGVRLLAPLSAALGSVLLADAGARLWPGRRVGLAAAVLLNATLLLGVGAVVMTPETPLILFWTAALWALARFWASGRGAWLVAVGLFAGLALDSKYTAVFLPFGAAAWLLLVPNLRRWLGTVWPWAGTVVGFGVFAPVLWWNAEHGWASFARQGGRAGSWDPARAGRYLGELLGSQIGLATPLLFALFAAGVAHAVCASWRGRDGASTLLAALTVPAVLVFVQHALGDRVQGNWPAVIYPAAALAAGGLSTRAWERLRVPAVALGAVITAAVYVQATLRPLPLSPHRDPTTLRLAGWGEMARAVDAMAHADGAAFVAADDYTVAAELRWVMPSAVPVLGAEDRWRFFALPPASVEGRAGLLVRSERRGDDLDGALWNDIRPVGQAARSANGQSIEVFRIYRVVGRTPDNALVILPTGGSRVRD